MKGHALILLCFCILAGSPWCRGDVNLNTPELQALREKHTEAKAKLDAVRLAALKALVKQNLDQARETYEVRKKAGNVTGMAVGRKAIGILEQCAADLEAKQDFEIASGVRRELKAVTEDIEARKATIEDEYKKTVAELEKDSLAELAAVVRSQKVEGLDEAELPRLFQELLAGKGTDTVAEAGTEPAPGQEGEAQAAAEGQPADKQVLASSGEGENWVTFAFLYGEFNNVIEVIDVPIANRNTPEEIEGTSPVNGEPLKTLFEPVRVLAPGSGYAFRLLPVPDKKGGEVVSWPRDGNDWTFTFRFRTGGESPSTHGLELQVSFAGAESLPRVGDAVEEPGQEPADDRPLVKVGIKTRPEGAVVYVNRQLYRDKGETLRTPCIVLMKEGPNDLRLRKTGYYDAILETFIAEDQKVVEWVFQENTEYVDKKLSVSARSAWRPSGVVVKAGDRLKITVTGTWSCGRKREETDAEGYPVASFSHYYMDPKANPRQLSEYGATYGCLLMRIGEDGPMVRVGKNYNQPAPGTGMIYFDINEADDGTSRRDNVGALTVQINKAPPK